MQASNTLNNGMNNTPAESWVDGKRHLWLLGMTIPLFPMLSGWFATFTSSELVWWFSPVFVYGAIPLMDWIFGGDPHNPPESIVSQLEKDNYYRLVVYAFIPLQFISLFWAMSVLTSGTLGWVGSIGLTLSIGMVSAVAFNTAHELGHKHEKLDQWLSKISLMPTAYGHFFVEHNRGHHIRVATPEDPASSRYGESYWEFLPRTMLGSLKSAWKIEATRMKGLGHSAIHWKNDNIQAWAMSVVLFAVMVAVFGWKVLPFMAAQAFFSITLFEIINYLEHYGLKRQKLEDGRYEPCQPEHSWNSNHIVTNLFLYQLQRHSDHHANPSRSFQALRHFEDVPQLPSGYAGMIPLAYITPLWRRVMDPKVKAHYGGDLSKANVQPRVARKLGLAA